MEKPLKKLEDWGPWAPLQNGEAGEAFRQSPCCSERSEGVPIPPLTLQGKCSRCGQAYVEFNIQDQALRSRKAKEE